MYMKGNTLGPPLVDEIYYIVMHIFFLVRCHLGLQCQCGSLGQLQTPPPTPLPALPTLLVIALYSQWGQSTLKLAINTLHSQWNSRIVEGKITCNIIFLRVTGTGMCNVYDNFSFHDNTAIAKSGNAHVDCTTTCTRTCTCISLK
jgi:hypothetical protein